MESIRVWIVSISAATMIAAVARALAPKNAAGKAVSFGGAALVMLALLAPLGSVDMDKFEDYTRKLNGEIELRAEALSEENQKLQRDIIENEIAAYILQRAEEVGVSCEVSVFFADGFSHSVSIELPSGDGREQLTEIIADECGIPRERQMYKISGV